MYEVALEAKFESQSFCRILKVPVAVMNERIRDTLGLSLETFLKQRQIHELRNRIFGEKDISDKVACELGYIDRLTFEEDYKCYCQVNLKADRELDPWLQ